MEARRIKNILKSPLPNTILDLPDIDNEESINIIKNVLVKTLPTSEGKNVASELKWNFILEKHSFVKKKTPKSKKSFLTRKQRRDVGLLKLPKEGWNYKSLDNLRQMWKDYMLENLDLIKKAPTYIDSDWSAFSSVIAKSELIGAELTVIRSKLPNVVGLTGTIVFETKMTFQIVTPRSKLKTIVKDGSVFEFYLNDIKFTVFGKYLSTKPSERSVKKIKSIMVPDL